MKKLTHIGVVSIILFGVVGAKADGEATNRFSFSTRLGVNISAKFKNRGGAIPRTTPDGSLYNYDNGYVLTDVSDNFGGETWNWGYDNSAQQVDTANSLISMSRNSTQPGSSRIDEDPAPGAELVFNRQIWAGEKVRFGAELAGNYLGIGIGEMDRSRGMNVTDFYPFTPGTTPPSTIGGPYQGTFDGPGFTIFTNFTSVTNIVSFSDKQRFDANLWGFRLGPYLEIPLGDRVRANLVAGLAVGLLDAHASWKQTAAVVGGGTTSGSGSGHDFEVLWGGYVGGNLWWDMNENWSLVAGAQYQNLGNYEHSFGGRKVEVDLSNSIFVTLGVGYSF